MKIEKLRNPYVRGNEGCSVSMIDLLEKINEIIDAMNGEHGPADIYSEDGRLIAKKDESEDEKIRKWVIEELEITRYAISGKNHYSDDPYIVARLKHLDEALDWLGKQKESLHISETCKENPDSFTDEDERIIQNLIDAFTEYKKSGGVDFHGIEINTLLAWLEKQKEQKPNIELIQRSWYMEGYHDREFGKEPKWILKTGESGPKHELNPRYGQSLAEQQPTEQQMHDLNEAIKCFRMDGCERMADSLHSLYIFLKSAYQQPTQEQKPISTEDMPYITDERFYEREPVDSFKYKLAEYMTRCCTKKEGPYGYEYGISAESILKMAEEELLKRGELQKPAESISQLTVQGKGVYKICPRCKERMVRDDSMVYTSMPPQYRYECPKCGEMEFDTVMYDNPEMEEQKPAVTHGETYHVDTLGTQQVIAGKMPQKPEEWSKNDTVFLNEITDFFENKTVRLQHDLDMYAHWLKSLPERFNLQPKQEWSEC